MQGKGLRVLESKITAISLAIGAAVCLGYIISHLPPFADSKLLTDYLRLFDESRVVHVSSLDALALVSFSPYWMYNDAERRQWSSRCATSLLLTQMLSFPTLVLSLKS